MQYIIIAILSVSLFIFINKLLSDNFLINSIKYIFIDKYNIRIKERKRKIISGEYTKTSFIEKLDHLILYSSIKSKYKYFTTEIFILITLIMTILNTYLFNKFVYSFFVFNLVVAIFSLICPYMILQLMNRMLSRNIDDSLILALNLWSNLCSTNTDIVQIFEKSIYKLQYPLNEYIASFVFQVKKGIDMGTAFKNLEDKIENNKVKKLMNNLYVTGKYTKKYKEVFDTYKEIIKDYVSVNEVVREEVREGRVTIISMISISIILFFIVMDYMANGDYSILFDNIFGNIILFINLMVVIISLVKILTLDKINKL